VQHAGPFFYIMIYTKQAIPLAQQVSILKQRGLIFANEQDLINLVTKI
jgi:hypothetical protein